MKTKNAIEPFCSNVKEKWGGLVKAEEHTAAVGMRLCDNRRREFQGFPDRKTVVGDYVTAIELQKFLASKKTISDIKRNTSFSFGVDDRNCWATMYVIGKNKDINVTLDVMCSGEYCYVRAYADRIPSGTLRVLPIVDDSGNQCWQASMDGRTVAGPYIYAKSKLEAMNLLLDFVANELEAKDCLE